MISTTSTGQYVATFNNQQPIVNCTDDSQCPSSATCILPTWSAFYPNQTACFCPSWLGKFGNECELRNPAGDGLIAISSISLIVSAMAVPVLFISIRRLYRGSYEISRGKQSDTYIHLRNTALFALVGMILQTMWNSVMIFRLASNLENITYFQPAGTNKTHKRLALFTFANVLQALIIVFTTASALTVTLVFLHTALLASRQRRSRKFFTHFKYSIQISISILIVGACVGIILDKLYISFAIGVVCFIYLGILLIIAWIGIDQIIETLQKVEVTIPAKENVLNSLTEVKKATKRMFGTLVMMFIVSLPQAILDEETSDTPLLPLVSIFGWLINLTFTIILYWITMYCNEMSRLWIAKIYDNGGTLTNNNT
jgi:hypothetical protein